MFNFFKRKLHNKNINVIGTYFVDKYPDVIVIELESLNGTNLNIESITQELNGIDRMSWQSPYDEKFLTLEGNEVSKIKTNRVIFFFHFFNFKKPLTTNLGDVMLSKPQKLPKRLEEIVIYQEVD